MTRLSKTAVAKLLQGGGAGIHWDDDLGGFGLRIYPSGVAAYIIDYRLKGSRAKRRVVLGKVAALSLVHARERAQEALAAARQGVDLDKEQRAKVAGREDEERRKANRATVRQAVGAYLVAFEITPSRRGGRKPASSSVRAANWWLSRLVAMHGETTLEDLTADQAQAVLDATPQSSRRNVYGAIRRLMDWARRQNLITASPVGLVDPPARPASRERTPSPGEVTAILSAADDLLASGRWRQVQRDGVWLLALTAQRRAEVASMAWEDLDLGSAEWRQPGAKNKTGKPHVVPLGRASLELLLLRWEAAERPSEGLVLRAVRGGGRMDANLSDLQGLLREVTGIAFRLHDLRRSAVSAMAEHGVDFAVADSILNHAASQSRGGVMAVYQHAELKGAKRRAVEIWEAALFPRSAQVIALRAR